MSLTPNPALRSCAVCGSIRKLPIFGQSFGAISSGCLLTGYEVVACADCGFCFADGIPEQVVFDEYYAEMSKYEHQESGGHESTYDLARFRQMTAFIEPLLPGPDTRILEIGCATGRLLALLKDHGFTRVTGVDPSPSCAATAERLYGIQVKTAKISAMPFAAGTVDFIVLAGVLEHIRDLATALGELVRLLSPTGRLYVCVPDASRFAQGEDAPFQEFSVEHINFFGPASMTNLMRSHGLSQLACRQEMMQVSFRTTTPVIHAAFQASAARTPLVADGETASGLHAYVAQSRKADDRIQQTVSAIAAGGEPVLVWGAGMHTLRLMQTSSLKDAKIAAFIDSNPHYQGKTIDGIPIIAPGRVRDHAEPIVISSRVYQEEIARAVREDLKLPNQLIRLYDMDSSSGVRD